MPQQIGVMAEGTVRTKKPATVDEMNLKSVRRLDPCAVTIIDKTAHAALYEFDREKFEWVKTAIEGPLFLYERADAPLHSLMIANRQSLKDLIEPILPPVLFFLETPYVFMNKLAERQIIGFWFFDEEDCKRFYEVLLRLAPQTTTHPSMAATNPEALVNGYRVNTNQSAGKPQFSIGTGPATNKNDQKSSIFDADSADRKHSQPSVAASPTASRSSHSSTTGNDPPVAAAAAEKARQYGNSSTSPSNKNAEPSNDICSAANKGDLHSSGNGMPALLRQILHKHSVSTLPALPTQGVLSADQIEEQYLTGDDEKKNAAAAPSGKAGSGNEKQKISRILPFLCNSVLFDSYPFLFLVEFLGIIPNLVPPASLHQYRKRMKVAALYR
ncbi:unnamed protein product [Gongylonema pulchrum]|uniref:WH1 domain-containing protein n=1 Tax=Gongylonema pulchrum TaxID=637853 RepID=A0A183EJ78_9BILA|nr:unnamed protein product [Gongylonema pulchrum]